jgi:hypothetical protein
MSSESKFDVEAVANKIKQHLVCIEKNEASLISHKRKAAELLLDVAENHPNELKEVCRLAGLQPSRTNELMQIARGKKTPQQIKEQTKRRVTNHRAKKKTTTAPPAPKPSPLHPHVTDTQNGVDLEASPATAEHKPIHLPTAKPPVSKSNKALGEFRYAVKHWLPKIKRAERMSAWEYAREIGEKLNAADDARVANVTRKVKALRSKVVANGATEAEEMAALDKARAIIAAYEITDEQLNLA